MVLQVSPGRLTTPSRGTRGAGRDGRLLFHQETRMNTGFSFFSAKSHFNNSAGAHAPRTQLLGHLSALLTFFTLKFSSN